MNIKLQLVTAAFIFSAFTTTLLNAQNTPEAFDKIAFYVAMSGDDSKNVKDQLAIMATATFPGKDAFEGAMLMKKAGVSGGPFDKLSNFKAGQKKLEAAITGDEKNAEFRFLRLIIQENAPGFLGYSDEIEKDSFFIGGNVKTLDPVVQKAVMNYSKKSKVLKVEAPAK